MNGKPRQAFVASIPGGDGRADPSRCWGSNSALPSLRTVGIASLVRQPRATLVVAGLVCLLGLGCSTEPNYPSTPLAGSVCVDGEPIAEGLLQIVPTKGDQGSGVSTEIKDGKFALEKAPLGSVIVMLTANRQTSRMTRASYSDELVPEIESLIPGRYASGIPLNITAGMGTQDFNLERRERFDDRRVRSR